MSTRFLNNFRIWFTSSVNMFFLITSLFNLKMYVRIKFIPQYYHRSENIWNDGFLFDFLQKKTVDAWVRQYVIYTGFLFSERVVFEFVVRMYNDFIIWPLHNVSLFESNNASSMLNTLIFTFYFIFILLVITFSLLI